MPFILLLAALLLPCTPSYGASMVAADVNEGYGGKVLNRLLAVWAPPPNLKGNFNLKMRLDVDGDGKYRDCTILKGSGMDTLDVSACGAARQVNKYDAPPGGAPCEVYISFWTGLPKGNTKEIAPDPMAVLRAEMLERDKLESSMGKQQADAVEERARDKAEQAAKRTGKTLPEVQPHPVDPSNPRPVPAPRLSKDSAPPTDKQAGVQKSAQPLPKNQAAPQGKTDSPRIQTPAETPAAAVARADKEPAPPLPKAASPQQTKKTTAAPTANQASDPVASAPIGAVGSAETLTAEEMALPIETKDAGGQAAAQPPTSVPTGLETDPAAPEQTQSTSASATPPALPKTQVISTSPQPRRTQAITAPVTPLTLAQPRSPAMEQPEVAQQEVALAPSASRQTQSITGPVSPPSPDQSRLPTAVASATQAQPPAIPEPMPTPLQGQTEKIPAPSVASEQSQGAASGASAGSAKAPPSYSTTVKRKLDDAIIIPAETPPGSYSATVRLSVGPDGDIEKSELINPTGDSMLDKFVLRSIRKAGKLPPPPAGHVNPLELTFKMRRR